MKSVRKKIDRIVAAVMLIAILGQNTVYAEETAGNNAANSTAVSLTSPSAILVEASTGTVLFEKNPDEMRSPASITKIMTLLLTFEALEKGRIKLEDEVITSAYAKSMGGSQVFLDEGEVQTVDTLIKCIAVASGNDASVAMAEYVAGSETEFVNMMNEKAAQLGMGNTHFLDCCGLSSDSAHHTTARDVAIMSRELVTKYPQVYNYTQIWMEDITHVTSRGSEPFTLSSTNKLLKQYQWTTGLKTGSTSAAKYCFSATASKNGIDLIAVIMGAPDYKVRFSEAQILLEYGFAVTRMYVDENRGGLGDIPVTGGKADRLAVEPKGAFRYLDVSGADFNQIEKRYQYADTVTAPVEMGAEVGYISYSLGGKELGRMPIVAAEPVEKAYFIDYLKKDAGQIFDIETVSLWLTGVGVIRYMQSVFGTIILIAIVLATALLAVGIIDGNRFVVVREEFKLPGLSKECRFVLISDLHNKVYGNRNDKVIDSIRKIDPDFIILAGDLVTSQVSEDMTPGIDLMNALSQRYEIYYGLGNHESKMQKETDRFGDKFDRLMKAVSHKNMHILQNESVNLPEYNIRVTGLDLDLDYFAHFKVRKMKDDYLCETLPECDRNKCNILIAHNPDYFEDYAGWGAQLVLSGHVHGGIMRLPFLGGVIAPSYKIFPKYDGGVFHSGKSTMLLGRGLGSHTLPFRFFNPAELYEVVLKSCE